MSLGWFLCVYFVLFVLFLFCLVFLFLSVFLFCLLFGFAFNVVEVAFLIFRKENGIAFVCMDGN